MLQLRTGSTSGYRSPSQLGAEIVGLINKANPVSFSSAVLVGQLPDCTVAAESYGLSITYADGLKVALQLQFDGQQNVVTEVLPAGRVSANDITSAMQLTSFSLTIGDNFVVISGNVNGSNYTYVAVVSPPTPDMDGVTTSRVFGAVFTPGASAWTSIPAMARLANGTQTVQKTSSAVIPVAFPMSVSSVSSTGVWSVSAEDFVRVLPRLLLIHNTGVALQPSKPILLAPGAMGWDEQVVVEGVVFKPCVIHMYSATNITLLVAQ